MAGDSLPSSFTLVHNRLHIMCYPGSGSEAIWDGETYFLQSWNVLFDITFLPLTFPSVKGWLDPGFLKVCSRCHRRASLFPLPKFGATESTEKQKDFLAYLNRDGNYFPTELTIFIVSQRKMSHTRLDLQSSFLIPSLWPSDMK